MCIKQFVGCVVEDTGCGDGVLALGCVSQLPAVAAACRYDFPFTWKLLISAVSQFSVFEFATIVHHTGFGIVSQPPGQLWQ